MLVPQEGQWALSYVLRASLAIADALPCHERCPCTVGTARKEKRDTCASCHQVPGAPHMPSAGSRQEGVQLQEQKYPEEINTGLINIRPTGDNCQTIGQQEASCWRDPH